MPPVPDLKPGDPAPDFTGDCTVNPRFHFNAAAGRYVAMLFFGSAGRPEARAALDAVASHPGLFTDSKCAFFGVTIDPVDREMRRIHDTYPDRRFFWDFDRAISRLYGVCADGGEMSDAVVYRPVWLLLDPMLRVLETVPMSQTDRLLKRITDLPDFDSHAGVPIHAPVLVLPRVFDLDLCRALIAEYTRQGGQDSGFMREINGRTIGINDHSFKRRRDANITDGELCRAVREQIGRRLLPEIHRCFSFKATRMERYIVACYDSAERGFFRPHRDNTSKGTAHRRFAVTINLNAEEYTGGDLRFPEFGTRTYRAPTGGAVVFACGLLHEATPVTKGRRYAFLPFLYDDEGARIRQQNSRFIGPPPEEQGMTAEPDATGAPGMDAMAS